MRRSFLLFEVPVFDGTRYFQPREDGNFTTMRSLNDFFAQAGAEVCPQISNLELRNKSVVAVAYTANKWGAPEAKAGDFNLGLNIRAVYLLINGPK